MIKILKIILINFIIFFGIFGFLFLSIPSIYLLKKILTSEDNDYRKDLKIYQDIEWSKDHFNELRKLKVTYKDYEVWKSSNIKLKTINVYNGLRKTTNSQRYNNEVWFFGGSSMWGVGVRDQDTIPSLFNEFNENKTTNKNFGEIGYISRQSTARLINAYLQNTAKNKKTIIFYDGVNEVVQRCRSEIKDLETPRENYIQEMTFNDFSFKMTFNQLKRFYFRIFNNSTSANQYDCDKNHDKALSIATTLVNNWIIVNDIVKNNGDNFLAVLQPVIYLSETDISYLDKVKLTLNNSNYDIMKKQYQSVYPKIKELMKNKNINFLDLTNVLDNQGSVYIDFCHLLPSGNKLIVKEILIKMKEIN